MDPALLVDDARRRRRLEPLLLVEREVRAGVDMRCDPKAKHRRPAPDASAHPARQRGAGQNVSARASRDEERVARGWSEVPRVRVVLASRVDIAGPRLDGRRLGEVVQQRGSARGGARLLRGPAGRHGRKPDRRDRVRRHRRAWVTAAIAPTAAGCAQKRGDDRAGLPGSGHEDSDPRRWFACAAADSRS
jgi:hypothetical protein